ncbi:MAG: MFS transporter, partial [Pseudonocardiaceae bacterium]
MNRSRPLWLYLLFVTLLATATDEFVIAGILPDIASDLGVSISVAGQLVTVFALVYALGAPLLGAVFERRSKRAVMVGGLAVFVLANVAAAVSPGYWFLMASRVIAAAAAAVITAAAFTTAAQGAPEGQQGRYLGVTVSGMTVALFTGVPVGSWLAGSIGWRAAFWVIAAIGTMAAVGLLVTAPSVAGSEPAPLRERLTALRGFAVLRLVGVTFLAASGGLMFYSYLSVYVADVSLNTSFRLLSILLFVVGLAGLGGALLAGYLTDSWGPKRTLRTVIGGHAIALALLAALFFTGWGNVIMLGVLIAVWSVFAWGLNPPIQGSILSAAGPSAGMSALGLNISG